MRKFRKKIGKKKFFRKSSKRLNTTSIFAKFCFVFVFFASFIFVKKCEIFAKNFARCERKFSRNVSLQTCRPTCNLCHTNIKKIQDNRLLTNSLLYSEESFLINEILRHLMSSFKVGSILLQFSRYRKCKNFGKK